MTNKLIAFSTDTIPDPNRIVGIRAWQIYELIHDKQAYEECKILVDKQKDQIKLGDSLIAIAQGQKINLERQVVKYDSIIVENNIQFETFKEKKKGQFKKLIKVILGETGLIIVETIIIILII